MKFMDFLAPDYRKFGERCHNCANLACEYDLNSDEKLGVWICEKFPENSPALGFPFEKDMPCFEPCFWFTVLARDLQLTDAGYDCYEAAQNKYREILAHNNQA